MRRVIIWLPDKLSEVAPRVCELLEHVHDRLFGLLVALGVEDLAQGGGRRSAEHRPKLRSTNPLERVNSCMLAPPDLRF